MTDDKCWIRRAEAGDPEVVGEALLAAVNWSAHGPVVARADVLARPEIAHCGEGWPTSDPMMIEVPARAPQDRRNGC